MSIKTTKNLFIVSSFDWQAGFYQQLIGGISSFQGLGNRVVKIAEQAQAFRQYDKVKEAAQILNSIPIKQYQAIGHYYVGLCEYRKGKNPKDIFERVAEYAPARYRILAMQSLAAMEARKQDYESELAWLVESLKVMPSVEALRGIAIVKAKEGYHRTAIKDLESLLPLLRISDPLDCYGCLNSYAVELGEVGQKEEARNISKIVLASPLALAYPEWQETGRELGIIGCKDPHSFVSLKADIEWKPAIPTKPTAAKKDRKSASVLPFRKLKEAPEPEKPERVSPKELGEMTDREKRELIITALRTDAIRASQYDNLIFQAGMLKTGPASKVVDLEDETVLNDLIIEWVHMIDPEELAAVISALRDCDDDIRRVNLMDSIIRKAFEYSAACGVSEEAWRQKVERRLPEK